MLLLILHLLIGATLSGVAIIVALVAGVANPMILLIAAGIGFVTAFPVSWVIAQKISG